MKAYCITLEGNTYSERVAARCIESAAAVGVHVERFRAVSADEAEQTMADEDLRWTWAHDNTAPDVCRQTGLKQHPYKTHDVRMRYACSMSHYKLWEQCALVNEPICILEHDTVFIRPIPHIPSRFGAIMLNDPTGATPRGATWAQDIARKGFGVHDKTVIFKDGRPDGLAGGSAYIITPLAAAAAMTAYHALGVWPNDATLCRQLIGGLQECYPFVTRVQPDKSMAEGY